MSYCAKRAPNYRGTVEPVGFYTDSSGVRTRNTNYDSSAEYMRDRAWVSSNTPEYKRMKKKLLPERFYQSYSGIVKDSIVTISRKAPSKVRWEGYSRMVVGTSHSALLNVRDQAWAYSSQIARNAANAELLKKISNMKFNAAQAFAERKQTANMLIHTVNRFVTFAVLFRKGRFKEANKILATRKKLFASDAGEVSVRGLSRKRRAYFSKDHFEPITHNTFANLWLEYSYGWRPLLSDIHGAAELLAQTHIGNRPTKSTGRGAETKTFDYSYTTEGLTGKASLVANIECLVTAYYDVSNALLDSAKSTGLSNPALLAWELIPYSFVVDWILPVGAYLENVNASSGLTFMHGSVGFKIKLDGTASSSSDNSVWVLGNAATMTYDYAERYRAPLTAFPSAQFPSVSLGLGLTQLTSGLSLLSQLFRR